MLAISFIPIELVFAYQSAKNKMKSVTYMAPCLQAYLLHGTQHKLCMSLMTQHSIYGAESWPTTNLEDSLHL